MQSTRWSSVFAADCQWKLFFRISDALKVIFPARQLHKWSAHHPYADGGRFKRILLIYNIFVQFNYSLHLICLHLPTVPRIGQYLWLCIQWNESMLYRHSHRINSPGYFPCSIRTPVKCEPMMWWDYENGCTCRLSIKIIQFASIVKNSFYLSNAKA